MRINPVLLLNTLTSWTEGTSMIGHHWRMHGIPRIQQHSADDLPFSFVKQRPNTQGWVSTRSVEELWKDTFTYLYRSDLLNNTRTPSANIYCPTPSPGKKRTSSSLLLSTPTSAGMSSSDEISSTTHTLSHRRPHVLLMLVSHASSSNLMVSRIADGQT